MAITAVSGFPVSSVGNGLATQAVTPVTVGDILICSGRVSATSPTVTAISGGGVTTWTKVLDGVDATDSRYVWLWYGVVTTTGAATITLTFSSAIGVISVEIVADSFTAGLGASTPWTPITSGSLLDPDALATLRFPVLTSLDSASMYWGYGRSSNSLAGDAVTGFTATTTASNDLAISKLNLVGGTTYSPTASQIAGSNWDTIAAIFTTTPSAPAPRGLILPRNTLRRGVRNRGQMALFLKRAAALPPSGPAGPAVLVATGADTSLSSDAATRALALPRTAADTSASSDSATRVVSEPRTTADTSASSDSATRAAQAFVRTTTDTSLSSDSASRAETQPRSASETSLSSDAATRVEVATRTGTESSLSSDTASRAALSFARSAADTSASSDSASRVVRFPRIGADASTSNDTATATKGYARSASDTSLSSDTATRTALSFARTTADASNSSDTATRLLRLSRTGTDTSSSSDTAIRLIFDVRSGSDTSLTTDSATRRLTVSRSSADVSLTTDSTTQFTVRTRSTADTSVSFDSAIRLIALVRTTSDSSLSTDLAAGVRHSVRFVSDSSLTSDHATNSTTGGTPPIQYPTNSRIWSPAYTESVSNLVGLAVLYGRTSPALLYAVTGAVVLYRVTGTSLTYSQTAQSAITAVVTTSQLYNPPFIESISGVATVESLNA